MADKKAAEPQTSEADEAQKRKGELTGKVRGQDVDSSHHVYEFTDPQTGEPLETTQVVHDVATGVNKDGSVTTEKMTDSFAKASDTKQSAGANQGEAGETKR